MRLIHWLLLAAFLALVGACPSVASFVGSLLWAVVGLGLHGAAVLLAAWLGVHLYRNRRIA